MNELNLYVVERINPKTGINETQTQIGKKKKSLFSSNKIVFHNESSKVLTLDFDPPNRIQNDAGVPIATIDVDRQSQVNLSFVSTAKKKDEVRYTAKIVGAAKEDPIIILE